MSETLPLVPAMQQLASMPTGFVTDAMVRLGMEGWPTGVATSSPRKVRVAGRAVTMEYGPRRGIRRTVPPHYQVIRESGPGDVLVMAAHQTPCWVIGENVCHTALEAGLEGIVVDGCIRDAAEIAEMDFTVFSRGPSTRPYFTHLELTRTSGPVNFGGAQIYPGDFILGDADGLVVVPDERVDEVLHQALDIQAIEQEQEQAIKSRAPLPRLLELTAKKKVKA